MNISTIEKERQLTFEDLSPGDYFYSLYNGEKGNLCMKIEECYDRAIMFDPDDEIDMFRNAIILPYGCVAAFDPDDIVQLFTGTIIVE